MTNNIASIEQEVELRAAIQYAVLQLDEKDPTKEMTPEAIQAVAEMVYLYATQSLAKDLDAFCEHAGRKMISEADVKLVVRKNLAMHAKLSDFCAQQQEASNSKPKKKRGHKKAIDLQANIDETSSLSEDEPSSDEELMRDMHDFSTRTELALQQQEAAAQQVHESIREQKRQAMEPSEAEDEKDDDSIIFMPPKQRTTKDNQVMEERSDASSIM